MTLNVISSSKMTPGRRKNHLNCTEYTKNINFICKMNTIVTVSLQMYPYFTFTSRELAHMPLRPVLMVLDTPALVGASL